MEVLIIVGAIQAIFFAVLVFSKKGKSVSDKILALWFSIFGMHLSFVYYSFLKGHVFYIEYGYITSGVLVIYYTLMYIYTQSLISKENVFKAKWLRHLIPTTLLYISIIPLARLSYDEKVDSITLKTPDPYLNFVFIIIILFITAYLVATLRLLKKHKISIRKMFSYEEDINLNWLRILSILLMLLWIVMSSIIAYVFYHNGDATLMLRPEDHMIIDMQGQIAFVVFVFLLGFFGIRQQVVYSTPKNREGAIYLEKENENGNRRYKKSGLKLEDSSVYLQKLLQYMEEDKPYLNGKLSLRDVAGKVDISTNHLSQVINENLGKNFFDFVSGYRVALVKQKIKDPENRKFTILTLAFESGFNSKSSFNAIFKKLEGITPTEFLKRV